MIRYMNIGAGATIRFAATAVAITITALLSSEARAALVNWNGNSGLNYNVMSNWDGGFFPEDGFNEEAVIGNGDAVFLNANVTEPAGLQVVGVSSFEVRSGGTLNVKHGIGGGVQPPGDIKLGKSAGLIIQSGGTLTALMGMADLSGTTRLVGPTATFTVGELNLAGSHTLIAEITDPLSHSALSTSGSAALAGALVVDLSAVAPSVGDSWTLMDAGSISGSFANVTSPTLRTPDLVCWLATVPVCASPCF